MKTIYKKIILIITDAVIVYFAYWLAAYLRYDGIIPQSAYPHITLGITISLIPIILLSFILGTYNILWRYVGIDIIFRQALIVAANFAILMAAKYYYESGISGSISVNFSIILFVLTSGVRITPRGIIWVKHLFGKKQYHHRRAVIVGAGETGTTLIKRAREAARGSDTFHPVAVIDNDKNIHGTRASGVKIVGGIDDIDKVCKEYDATEIIVALPNATKDQLFDIYRKCITANLPIKSSQSLADVKSFMQEDNTALKNVTIEDLLFREAITPDMTPVCDFLEDKVVLVTGGAGSIGSELCRQVLACGCKQLIIYDFNENGLYDINEELVETTDRDRYVLCLGSIRDRARLDEVMNTYKPYVVFHAAAHKHVPMLELNPFEAVKNNVKGTKNVIEACIANKVHKFILISTDKAVNPVNMLGASKRVAEMLVENMKVNGVTQLAAVRFGNVLGSVGSVIPQFKRQIAAGGPVTVTHKDIVRFFMTISEAVSLVLTAGVLAKDGEIFILDMGKPVKILDLANDLIRLSGYEPGVDIEIKIIGLRPGEKLYEELFLDSDQIDTTSNEKIFILKDGKKADDFEKKYEELIELASNESNENALRDVMFEMVGTGK